MDFFFSFWHGAGAFVTLMVKFSYCWLDMHLGQSHPDRPEYFVHHLVDEERARVEDGDINSGASVSQLKMC